MIEKMESVCVLMKENCEIPSYVTPGMKVGNIMFTLDATPSMIERLQNDPAIGDVLFARPLSFEDE